MKLLNKMPKGLRRQVNIWLISGLVLIVFAFGFKPLELPLPLLLLPFVILGVWLRSAGIALGMILRRQSVATRKVRVIATSLAAIILLIIILMSLGQLSWRDIMLVSGLVVGLMFYFYKTDLF